MHRTIAMLPGPSSASAGDQTRGITGLVYRGVRSGIHVVGRAVDASIASAMMFAPNGEPSDGGDRFRAAINGVYGDYLAQTGNPMAIDMSLHHRDQRVDLDEPMRALGEQGDPAALRKLLVLVHGSCMSDRQWHRDGHDHGVALADELNITPLYLRYNSGLQIASNGRAFAKLLETLIGNWPHPVHELVILGYSMGGLVARSACHHAEAAGHTWPKALGKLIFLGTPHHGAPLAQGGHGLDVLMELSPYSRPLTRISRARSAGITDLRHGRVSTKQGFVPLPADVNGYAVAAARASASSVLSERLVGDGLVPVDSALGRHSDASRTLNIPMNRQWVGYQMGHFDLLNHPDVYARIHRWMRRPA